MGLIMMNMMTIMDMDMARKERVIWKVAITMERKERAKEKENLHLMTMNIIMTIMKWTMSMMTIMGMNMARKERVIWMVAITMERKERVKVKVKEKVKVQQNMMMVMNTM